MLVEFLLEFFIGVVDVELFKGVFCEVFEVVDIKDINEWFYVVENIISG